MIFDRGLGGFDFSNGVLDGGDDLDKVKGFHDVVISIRGLIRSLGLVWAWMGFICVPIRP